ncbi:MAG: bacillithiol biosynthesis deacetylase BshB1 [Planctomycetia bacterium]|nr:bacillithiol biosynthesis deacetylase BshB1 [Planctomycetia bacterium]
MKTPSAPLDVLVVAPHPDDAEIGVGGTILACRLQGLRVGVIDLTTGEPTPHGSRERRASETDAATRILGLDWRANLGLPNRSLEANLESRRALASVFRLTRPKIIVAPYWEDAHPDHVVASRLADDARFWSKLSKTDMLGEPYWPPKMLYFFSIHLRIHPKPSFVFDITPHIHQKMAAIHCYESQFITGREQTFPSPLDDIRDRARYWGWTIGTSFAEPFANREEIGLSNLKALL